MKGKSLMNRIKWNDITVFLFCMCLTVSAPSFAQKQKKEKQQKEQTAKPKKQSNTKQRLIEFATEKVAKKGTLAYNAQREAARIAMDSIMRFTRTKDESEKHFGEYLQQDYVVKFADLLCAKFDNDPVFMDSVASGFYTIYGDAFLGEKRFAELKQMHPNFVDAYYTEALLFHTLAWAESSTSYNPEFLRKAKEQIDSAKLIVPNDPEPYMKWVRWQGKYDPEGIYTEIDTLKMRIPSFPGYLEIAREFALRADDDRMFLPSARKTFQKAEHDHMKLGDYQLYANICYRIGSSQKLKEDFQEGVAIANEGLSKFPKDPILLRFKLYNQSFLPTVPARTIDGARVPQLTADEKKEAWDSAYAASLAFDELPDTFKRTATDYRWMGQANMETKHYAEAVSYFKKQIEMGLTDSTQYATALLNIINCDRQLSEYDDAISTFAQLEKYKQEHGMEVDAMDYNEITHVYRLLLGDTLQSNEARLNAYVKMDSLCLIAAKVSPENSVTFESRILQYMFNYLQIKLGKIDVTDEEFKRFAEGVIDAEKSYQATLDPFSIPHANTLMLFWAYRQLLLHYYYTERTQSDYDEKMQKAYDITEIMLDMPLAMELTDLTKGQSDTYTEFMTLAEDVNGSLRGTYGKKRRR